MVWAMLFAAHNALLVGIDGEGVVKEMMAVEIRYEWGT